jgi:hypothetical protein
VQLDVCEAEPLSNRTGLRNHRGRDINANGSTSLADQPGGDAEVGAGSAADVEDDIASPTGPSAKGLPTAAADSQMIFYSKIANSFGETGSGTIPSEPTCSPLAAARSEGQRRLTSRDRSHAHSTKWRAWREPTL